jgi:hypothetical protein
MTSKREEMTGKKLKRMGYVKKDETGDFVSIKNKNKFRGFSPPANYTDRVTTAYRRS